MFSERGMEMKSKIKKIIIFIYCIVIAFSLTSCDNKTPGLQSQPWSSEGVSETSSVEKVSSEKEDPSGKGNLWADKRLRIGLAGPGSGRIWNFLVSNDLKHKSEEWNIVLYNYSEPTSHGQVYSMKKFIEYDMDIIALCTYEYHDKIYYEGKTFGWDEALEVVREAGIPVILVDQEIYCEDESLWVTRVGNDWEKEGEMAGEWLIDYLKKEGRIDEKIKILEFSSMENPNNASQERGQGFKEAIKENINLEITSKEVYPDKTYSYEEMANILSETTDIDVLFCHNDDMALGAIQAIEEAGLVPGEDILIISVDGSDKILEYIAEGKVACSVECNPLMGDLFMEACVRLANGEEIEREIHPVDRVFDITNAQAELDARKENGYGY